MAEARDVDFRVKVTPTVAQQIDALVQSRGFEDRGDWFNELVEREIKGAIHSATVLLRMCNINPLAREGEGR